MTKTITKLINLINILIENSIIGSVYLVVVTEYMELLVVAHPDSEETEYTDMADTTYTMSQLVRKLPDIEQLMMK